MHYARFIAVVLHKYVIPNLDVTVTIFIGAAGRAAWYFGAVIIEDLSAGAARSGIAHHPKIIRSVASAFVVTNSNNAVCWNANDFIPNFVCFVIFGIHRDQQLLLG